MKLCRAISAGLAGGVLVIAIVRLAGWLSGGGADLCALIGAVVTGRSGAEAWVVGGVAQLAEAVGVAVLFAMVFEWVTRRAGAAIGLPLAVPLVVIAGLAVGVLPAGRLTEAGTAPPGVFMEHRGAAVVAGFVVAHLLFGIVVGATYGRPRHAVSVLPASGGT